MYSVHHDSLVIQSSGVDEIIDVGNNDWILTDILYSAQQHLSVVRHIYIQSNLEVSLLLRPS